MNFSVTLLTIFLLLRTTIVTSCTASYSVQGQALQNHIFREDTAERIVDCIALCTTSPGCHSSNFYRIDKRCELSDKTHASHPEDMVHVPYTIYMENIFRACRNNLNCEGMPCVKLCYNSNGLYNALVRRTALAICNRQKSKPNFFAP